MKMKKLKLYLHFSIDAVYSALLLVWYFWPLITGQGTSVRLYSLKPETVALLQSAGHAPQSFSPLFLTIALYTLLLGSLFKIGAPFLHRRLGRLWRPRSFLQALLSLYLSSLVIMSFVVLMFEQASSIRFFENLLPLDYLVIAASFAVHAVSISRIIDRANRTRKPYRDYLVFKRRSNKGERRVLRGNGIQQKLILYFISLFLVIIVVLIYFITADFKQTILKTVFFNGTALAERAASIIKANIGDEIAIGDYFAIEKDKRAASPYSFKSITFFQRQDDRFTAAYSTDETLLGSQLQSGFEKPEGVISRYNEGRNTFDFLAPVELSRILVGYVLVDYDRELIYEPFFRTQVKVVTVSFLFLYLSIFLIYIFGTNIVFPILLLKMSVNRISNALFMIIKGRKGVSRNMLKYQDMVRTRDEIKSLSREIQNMTKVIRGVIPYISVSTLRHAESAQPSSTSRELAFLFTDICGFTSLCEGLDPGQVVEILNHYLEIQSTIIHKYNGDIDKFVGDEVMAMFDGPHKEINAARASMEIRTATARDKEARSRLKQNTVSIGIGINSGPVVFGSVGARSRMDFTSIGDTVNLAARLESANRTYGTKALVSESVYDKIKDAFLCREIDFLRVKGKSNHVRVYEILQEWKKAGEKIYTLKEEFEKGLELYRERRWDRALESFTFLSHHFNDEPSRVFVRRIELYQCAPPEKTWDGVFSLTSK